jgi:hypothetical protein
MALIARDVTAYIIAIHTLIRCTDGFTVRALLDDGGHATGEAGAQQVLLCYVDGFKYEYKVIVITFICDDDDNDDAYILVMTMMVMVAS